MCEKQLLDEITNEKKNNRIVAGALLLVAGGIIGTGLTLLLAPQSGQRTRRDIARYGRKVKAHADEALDNLTDTVADLVDSIGDKTEDILDKGKDAAGDARMDLIRLIEKGAHALEKFSKKLREM